jgi:predicted RNA-binding Zn-ribbon protein involved in translation (DUF1610 family)
MTTRLLGGKPGMPGPGGYTGSIGESDADVFDCPACARPLVGRTSRCPGCGTRLVMRVKLRKVGMILALGIVLGVVAGGGMAAGAIMLSQRDPKAAAVALPAAPASPTPRPTPSTSTGPTVLDRPQAAVSALSGTAVVNGRMSVDAATLSSTLADKGAPAIDIARALRSLAADAALGIDLTDRLAPWRDAAPVMSDLDTFYRAVADSARNALRASLTDTPGYRAAGATMVKVLAGLGPVDATSRALALTIDLELPPVVLPRAKPGTTPAPTPAH